MIIAVSDVHLGWKDEGKQEEFLKFLNACNTPDVDHFVLCGDIFDLWRRTNCNIFSAPEKCEQKIRSIVRKNEAIFDKLSSLEAKNVHYVAGNHDYLIHRIAEESEYYPFSVKKTLRLVDEGKKYYFTHGYDIDVMATMENLMTVAQYEQLSERLCFLTDKTGWLASTIWKTTEILDTMKDKVKTLQSAPAERSAEMDSIRLFAGSAARNLFLGLKSDENLVFGHTHVPYVDEVKPGVRVGNTGAWGEDLINPENGKVSRNSYVRIQEGKMELKFYHGENPVG